MGCVAFKHTVAVLDIVAVGSGLTITIAVPVCGWLQEGETLLLSCILTKL